MKVIEGIEQNGVYHHMLTCEDNFESDTCMTAWASEATAVQADFIKLQVQKHRPLHTRNLELFNTDCHISSSLLTLL